MDAEYNWWGCADGPGNTDCDSVSGNVDYDPWLKASKDAAPVRENGEPTGLVNTASPTLSLNTDRPATCKYSESAGADYDSMTEFATTGGTSHSVELSNLAEGEHTYYVKCKSNIDGEPVNSDDYVISFTVDLTSPQITDRSPGINAVGVDATTNITVTFSEDVICSEEDWSNCITLSDGGPVSGSASYADATDTLTFDPVDPLASNTVYTVTLSGITDLAGNSLSGTTSWTFTTATYYSIAITTGWNLISVPTVPVDTSIDAVLGDAKDKIDAVWTYDAVDDKWYVYHPNNPETSNLDTMTAGYGYWISATGDANIEGYGSLFTEGQTPPQRQLVGGWNLIGYYQKDGVDSIRVNYALSTLADDYCDPTKKWWTSLVGYDNTGKSFTTKSWSDNMNPGEAFWIFMKSSAITYMYGPGESSESCK
ncbi:MAG TPA: hypothetical protein ENG12_02925 [Candidatus Altiarchaeales archaeon]|nr:hypothetical protein [Candidatus Altiarchaeales archaeon]